MSDFKWRHYQGYVILGCVRWYCKYGISYHELEGMMLERDVEVDYTTIYRCKCIIAFLQPNKFIF